LNPGGYFEFKDVDLTPFSAIEDFDVKSSALGNIKELLWKAYATYDIDLSAVSTISSIMKEVGFVDIEERRIQIPFGKWATSWTKGESYKGLGILWGAFLLGSLDDLTYKPFQQGLGWPHEEYVVHLALLKKKVMVEYKTGRMYFYMTLIYGRKAP